MDAQLTAKILSIGEKIWRNGWLSSSGSGLTEKGRGKYCR